MRLDLSRCTFASLACSLLLSAAPARAADQALIDAAKKEGSVTWYTTEIIDQLVRPIADAFEKKYGVKVNYVRANTADISLRVLNEARAGQIGADLIDGDQFAPEFDATIRRVPRDAEQLGQRDAAVTVEDLDPLDLGPDAPPSGRGTISLVDYGPDGSDLAIPFVRPGQTAAVRIGAVRGGRAYVACAVDHRAVDGALGAELIGAFKSLIENPVLMLV